MSFRNHGIDSPDLDQLQVKDKIAVIRGELESAADINNKINEAEREIRLAWNQYSLSRTVYRSKEHDAATVSTFAGQVVSAVDRIVLAERALKSMSVPEGMYYNREESLQDLHLAAMKHIENVKNTIRADMSSDAKLLSTCCKKSKLSLNAAMLYEMIHGTLTFPQMKKDVFEEMQEEFRGFHEEFPNVDIVSDLRVKLSSSGVMAYLEFDIRTKSGGVDTFQVGTRVKDILVEDTKAETLAVLFGVDPEQVREYLMYQRLATYMANNKRDIDGIIEVDHSVYDTLDMENNH